MIRLGIILLVLSANLAWSSPKDDLASPDQAIRDAAAKTLRATYKPVPREKWKLLLDKVQPGMSKEAFADLLRPYHPHSEGDVIGGGGTTRTYRLDDQWLLECGFDDRTGQVIGVDGLHEKLRRIWAKPPSKFTGTWIVYYVNGFKSDEIQYKNGSYTGTFTCFYDDGSKGYIQHYDAGVPIGDDTGYYRSGKISYKAYYKNGQPAGVWTWYCEDGSISSTRDNTK